MPKFSSNKIAELKEYLYYCESHDAKIEKVEYFCAKRELLIVLFNPIFQVRITMFFHNVEMLLAKTENLFGSGETVLSLSVEDVADLAMLVSNCPKEMWDALHICFEMFSSDKLHIVTKELTIETTK